MKNRVALLALFVIAFGLLTTAAQQRRASGASEAEYVVRFEGPIRDAWKSALIAAGAEIVQYAPDFAFSVRMQQADVARVAKLPGVVAVVSAEPRDKFARGLARGGTRGYSVLVDRDGNWPLIQAAIEATGTRVVRRDRDRWSIIANPQQLDAIALIAGVHSIDNMVLYQKHNEFGGGTIVGATTAHTAGYDGSTQTIAVTDTGLGNGTAAGAHADLAASRILSIFNWPGTTSACFDSVVDDGPIDVDTGHGTHVVSTAVGGGQPDGIGRGTAPAARLVFQSIENWAHVSLFCTILLGVTDGYYLVGVPPNIADLFNQSYTTGARIHSISWGSEASGEYTTASAAADDFVWSHRDMTLTMSAGNSGVDGDGDGMVDAMSITSPATAKNVITVGASENDRQSHWDCDTALSYTNCTAQGGQNSLFTYGAGFGDAYPANPLRDDLSAGDAQQMAAFSSRGPAADGRIKPDVVAPGTWILSGYSDRFQQYYDPSPNPQNGNYQYDGWGYPYNGSYKYMGGTSMSTPLVAGAAAVVRDFYAKTHQHAASAALVKATLINSALDLLDENNDGVADNAFPIPNMHEGWGRIDLANATDGSHHFADEGAPLATGERATFTVNVPSAATPLRISLVWTDYAASASALRTLVNDLDLKVIAPDGAIYRGNGFAGGWSVADAGPDRINNVENVYVSSPTPGSWSLVVTGYNVPMGPQSFALVVDGSDGPLGPPDLGAASAVVSVTATDAVAHEAALGTAMLRFSRSGDVSSDLVVRYGVTGTATPDADYVALSGEATIAAGSNEVIVSVIPIDDDMYEPDETIVVSLASETGYDIGDPTTATITVVSNDQKPDLVVPSVTAPATAGAGGAISVGATVKNQGTGSSPASAAAFYLSANTSLDATDRLLGSHAVPPLAPGASDTQTASLMIPAATSGGIYYVLTKADWDNAVTETYETNNVRASAAIKVGPDIVVTAITAPASAAQGAVIAVTDTTKNQGAGGAPPSATVFYLSTNTVLDAADPRLGLRAVEDLPAGALSTASTNLTIPPSTAGGAYYVLAVADGEGSVIEAFESNNVKSSAAVKIGADLAVTSLTGPATGGAGASVTVTDATSNPGAVTAPVSITGFYWSNDSTLSATDSLLGERTVSELLSGGTHSASTSFTIPPTASPGRYYIIAKADVANGTAEANEANNTRSLAINIGPDLVVSSVVSPGIGGAGKTVSVSDTIRNAGVDSIAATNAAVYLSTNATLDASDTLLATHAVGALTGASSATNTVSVVIPETTSTGNYFILVQADRDNTAAEFSESNNVAAGSVLRIGPDLVVSALSGPSTAIAGATITVNDTAGNTGGGDAPASTTTFYLSTDSSIDMSDVMLGTHSVPALQGGGTHATPTSLTLPTTLLARTYYVIAKIDAAGQIGETADNNNTKSYSIRISVP
jgi:subtilase family serine protease